MTNSSQHLDSAQIHRKPLRGLFITGTDTGVGKTHISSIILRDLRRRGYRTGAYKPVCSGAEQLPDGNRVWTDVEVLSAALDREFPDDRICPQRFAAPLAPPVAAAMEGKAVDAEWLRTGIRWWQDQVDWLVVEGVGGWLCPLAENETVADLAADLDFPVLVVARQELGVINHTLLTVEAIRQRKLRVAGIVLNHTSPASVNMDRNAQMISRHCDAPILAEVPHQSTSGLPLLSADCRMDWSLLMSGPS